jgi:hypothetical protein
MDTQTSVPAPEQTNPAVPPKATQPPEPQKMSNTIIFWMIGITVLLAVEAGFLYYKNIQLEKRINAIQTPPVIAQPTPDAFPSVIPNEPTVTSIVCGGFAGTKCPSGYTCQVTATYPDATGTCVANSQTRTKLTCPQNGYVDCMPGPNSGVKYECTPEAMNWFKANCPDFKGGAM